MEKTSPADAVEQTTYVRILSETDYKESMTADGDYEITFGGVATLAMTGDAAEKLFWMIGNKIPELREIAASHRLT
ncbi:MULTISPECIES: hypothetical protein [Saccharothrix]|uniref:hypothetical protein n=1 Tax=Saccharothrix TaxID=2071 RepID=UPI00093C2672|nr:hypothetical protein [Saccharothrix sp. CB00851]OKI33335.1 hypothetical protein A6A25_06070 [Saccharothrix sp. CB00851]